ncbi:Uncharacterised protein [Mycobacterium tuberculosis]|uniref:Uncharacterized protein n=1 Tax=Mycobacterium tuberculosis TaxID=1773 RepID=A0A916LEW9_MYCTX|nr:Uncharacterised protein [Mycobacterium tuberculosis]COY80654.1 Uncharacterised protein [Mycobacterium tuberculosis]COZ62934.1 Uncharacterised protein [Mycobacterium tuberculosis]CPA28813.1 Uncharacterised protein [Mycobacterium tuberculosis]
MADPPNGLLVDAFIDKVQYPMLPVVHLHSAIARIDKAGR